MALTRNFKQTVVARVESDPAFSKALLDEAAHWQKTALARCATLLDEAHDYAAAAQTVRQLLFVEKFIADVENALAS